MTYTLYINTPEKITEIPLPSVNNKRINVDLSMVRDECSLEFEVLDGHWTLFSSANFKLMVDDKSVQSTVIEDNAVITLSLTDGETIALIVKESQPEKNIYRNFSLSGKREITVGRADDNDIIISDDFVGSHHCTISVSGDVTITDNSKNGTFVNGIRVNGSVSLSMFDTIYIVGHKLIFLGGTIAVSEADKVRVGLPAADLTEHENKDVHEDKSFFSRAPRRIEPLDTETVEIDDPPAKNKSRPQPLIFIIGPSVTMPIPILVSVLVNITANSGAGRSGTMYLGTVISVILSALIGTGWALAHQMYNKKQLAADEKERTEAYNKYIENNKNLLEEKHEKNKNILENKYLSTSELSSRVRNAPEVLWNRNIYQSDFLTIRLGSGKVKLPSDISVSKQRFSMNDDELCKYPHELYDKYKLMDNSVSVMSLIQHKIVGMVGDNEKLPLIANNIICQIAGLHCYTDVKIGFLGEISDKADYMWVKWLPHTFMRGKEARIIGFDASSHETAVYDIVSELRRRTETLSNRSESSIMLPHLVIFCTSVSVIRNSVLSKYMTSPAYLGVTFVLVYGGINMLPNECKAIIEYSADFSGFYLLDEEITEENHIEFEYISAANAEKFARSISGYYVDEISTGGIPQSVDYFEMIGIGKIEQWSLIKNYKMNHSFEGLRSFLGIGQGGAPVYLDIHDKKDGPHGLVAGTTGSGKSETLQTYILSLAMNYSPDEVAFVLIDYKGGGMANVFKGLPHVAGMITNLSDEASGELDRSLTRRACSSLRSEIKHRQTVFANYKVNSIDTYSRLFSEGQADEALPHLVIISDEFAELKKEQPEFIKELVSVARVGRSLGIHLILATQKPSGVVDDEIWSNSRFRICLRVQDKQDSNGMLKRPDAAYITEAGRAYLQIGNDEIFEEFQSGYSGGEYVPKESVVSSANSEAAIIDINGIPAVVRDKRKSNSSAKTEIETAVAYISDTVKGIFSPARTLWLPPLERNIYLEDIDIAPAADSINAVYGMVDNYEQQKRYPCTINFSDCSNLKICGTTGSGKTTLLQTILCSLVRKYTPEQLNFYIIDLSSRTFKMFKNLPHCGGVVYEEENEATERLIKLMLDIIEERKHIFEKEDIGSYKEYVKLHSLPMIIIAIDNFGAFLELYGGYEEVMIKLLHDCVRYGIQIVMTVSNTSEIKYKMRSYVLGSVALRMAEKSEYSEFLGRNPKFAPAAISGRGLLLSGGSILEYQAALPIYGENESDRSENMKKFFAELTEKYKGCKRAVRIPVISADINYSELLEGDNYSDRLLLGYNYETIMPHSIPLKSFFCYCVSGNGYEGISLFFNALCGYAEYSKITIKAVRLNTDVKFELPKKCDVYTNIDGIGELMAYLHKEFGERNQAVPEWNNDNRGMPRDGFMAEKFGRTFVIIDDMAAFCEMIYGGEGKNYAELSETFFKNGRNHGIHFFAGYNSAKKTYLAASNTFKSENHGIHFGGDAANQNVLDINIPLPQKIKKFASNIGFSVEDGKVETVYLPESKLESV